MDINREHTLSDISPGERAVVRSLHTDAALYRRLLDIGLTPGTEVECVGRSPCGDPAAYLIRGAVIAIRAEDGKQIAVERAGGASAWV